MRAMDSPITGNTNTPGRADYRMDKELTPAWVLRWSEDVHIKVETFIGQTIVLDAIHSPIFDDITGNIQDQEGINLQWLFS